MERDDVIRASATPSTTSDRSYVDWGAILAGAAVAAGISAVFTAFGASIGLGAISAEPGEGMGFGSVVLTGLYLVVTMVLAYMGGGYIAGRMRRRVDGSSPDESAARDGIHGLVVWGLGMILSAMLVSSIVTGTVKAAGSAVATAAETAGSAVGGLAQGVGSVAGGVVQGAGALVGNAAQGIAQAADEGGNIPNPLDYLSDSLLRSEAAAPDQFSNENLRREVGSIIANVMRTGELPQADRAYLERAVAARTQLSQPEVSARIDQAVQQVQTLRAEAEKRVEEAKAEAQRLKDEAAQKAEQLKQQAIDAAESARRAGVLSGFVLAASALVAAVAAFIGAQRGGVARDEGRIWGGLTHRSARRR